MPSNPPPPATTEPGPDAMDIDQPDTTTITTTTSTTKPPSKTRTLTTTTLRSPPFSYAHLTLTTTTTTSFTTPSVQLDALQLRSYLTTALRQFLGATGAAIPVDILFVEGSSAWVRVPRADLAAFAAGVTAFAGLSSGSNEEEGDGGRMLMQLRACGDWLGSLIGREEEGRLWTD